MGIENLMGSLHHADRLTGDNGNNVLRGWGGDDTLNGGDGDDTLDGGDGDDTLDGGSGADVLDGWSGADRASYWSSDAGVTVNLATGTARGGHAEGDTLMGIENLTGSRDHADRLTGDGGNNWLVGGGGDDTLDGGAGDDYLEGGFGADVVDGGLGSSGETGGPVYGDTLGYVLSDAGVTVDLAAGTAAGGHAEGDTFTGIESIDGSDHADHLSGDDGDNQLRGMDGDDTLDGGAGWDELAGGGGADMLDGGAGPDTLDGGAGDDALDGGTGDDELYGGSGADKLDGGEGTDVADYSWSDAGVTVNLATGKGQGGDAEGDTLTGIENVTGSWYHANHLTGDDGNNHLVGGLYSGDDTLDGGAGDDELYGGSGADRLDGGEGTDWTRYSFSSGVTVNLATGAGQGGDAEGDTLTGIENIEGSWFEANHLTGDDGNNRLVGGDGDDTLVGGDGDDTLDGGDGDDTLTGGAGDDTFVFGDGDAIADFGDGGDTIDISGFGNINADNFETNVTIRQSDFDVEVQIGDAVLTLNRASAADITVDDFLLA